MAKIRKRGNSYQIDYFDPTGKRIRKSFSKKKDAAAELGKRVSLIAEGRYLDVKRDYATTLKELIEKYEENYKNQAVFKTFKKYCIKNFKEHFGEDNRLSNIKYVDIETYRNHLRNNKLTKHGTIRKEATVNREISCLRHMFTKAVEWEMMEINPFEKGKCLIMKENNKRLRYLDEDEITRLLNACHPYLKDIVQCALNTGMRRGEILSLKWEQIRNGFIYLQKTKTKESREIPINNVLQGVFNRLRKAKKPSAKVIGLNGKPVKNQPIKDGEHVFLYNGKHISEIKRSFNGALTKAAILNFHFHDLRHTFASHLIMKGASLKEVQEILGHKTMTMTLRYAHLSQESKKKAVNLLNGLTAPKKNYCHKTVTLSNPQKSEVL